jgi:DNA gyrase subunit B
MPKKTPEYNNQSIKALKGADRVRKRPAVIFGSDGLEGCCHSFFEILSNSVDEAREGYGREITVTFFADKSIEIADRGRGIPLGYNEAEGRYNWELIYCELYAGGKYNNSESSAYEFSLGLNGLGACATQYSSEWFEVYSYNGETVSSMKFRKGEPVGELTVEPLAGADKKARRTGTVQRWKPDLEVFTDIAIPREFAETTLKKQAVVNEGLRFVLRWEGEEGFETTEYFYEHGILDYIAEVVGEDAVIPTVKFHLETRGRDREDKPEYRLLADVAFTVSPSVNLIEYYHNSSFLEHGGSPDRAVRSAFVYALDRYLKSTGKYNKNESKITFADIEDCLVLVSSSYSVNPSYANQTKKAITNSFIAEAMTAFLKEQLTLWCGEHPADADAFAARVLVNKRSREEAESTRLNIKKKLTGTIDAANRVEKFVGCRSKDPEKRELYIVEGDSALTSVKLGRNAEFQAIIPVRGKTLNCLKATYDRIFKNETITDLLRVIGCGVELKGRVKGDFAAFDLAALKWSKIILCTDADEDGFQIRTLLLTVFYRLLPSLISAGRIYIAETPLYEITETKTQKTHFAYDEAEKAAILKQLGSARYTIQRSKGLGENEPEMMWQTTMNPATRRLIRVTEADAMLTATMFDTLLGDNLAGRKDFIAKKGAQYIRVADI